ncbi:MAG TPA: hypothetical protein VLJ68_09895 [Chitinophagaceae bacterium]|nr:hypothetical protein [Chitinophagaceae bacterium]
MRIKKIIRTAAVVLLMAIALPAFSSNSVPGSSKTDGPAKTEDSRGQQLVDRLEQIKGMNRSEMTSLERKNLRKEVREIKKDLKVIKGGVYLSVGAIIVIILVLILIL